MRIPWKGLVLLTWADETISSVTRVTRACVTKLATRWGDVRACGMQGVTVIGLSNAALVKIWKKKLAD